MDALEPKELMTFCPRCGAGGFAGEDGPSLRCGACSFRFFYNSAAAVDVILEDAHGRIVVTRRAAEPRAGTLDLPGGFVSPGESLEEAARRELREELGIEPGALEYLGSFPNRYPYGGLVYFALDVIFVSRVGELTLRAGDDVAHAELVDPRTI